MVYLGFRVVFDSAAL